MVEKLTTVLADGLQLVLMSARCGCCCWLLVVSDVWQGEHGKAPREGTTGVILCVCVCPCVPYGTVLCTIDWVVRAVVRVYSHKSTTYIPSTKRATSAKQSGKSVSVAQPKTGCSMCVCVCVLFELATHTWLSPARRLHDSMHTHSHTAHTHTQSEYIRAENTCTYTSLVIFGNKRPIMSSVSHFLRCMLSLSLSLVFINSITQREASRYLAFGVTTIGVILVSELYRARRTKITEFEVIKK